MRKLVFTMSILAFYMGACSSEVSFSPADPERDAAESARQNYALDNKKDVKLVNQVVLVPQTPNAVDILFVIDNSESMDYPITLLSNKFSNFIDSLSGLDWQICVTTTDITNKYGDIINDGRLYSFSNGQLWINSNTKNAENLFLSLLAHLPDGSGDERGIFAINRAIQRNEGCFRQNASLNTVLLSDEDERSLGGNIKYNNPADDPDKQFKELEPLDFSDSVLATLKSMGLSGKKYTHHSIIIRPGDNDCLAEQKVSYAFAGTHSALLTNKTNGVLGNICAAEYGEQLNFMGENIQDAVASVDLECEPYNMAGSRIINADQIIQDMTTELVTTQTLTGSTIKFSPELPAGASIYLKYYCLL